jgi:hypothetical protein
MANFKSSASAAKYSVPGDLTTIQDAIDDANVVNGDVIMVGPGIFTGALVDKSVEIKGVGGAIINDGLAHPHPSIDNQGFRLRAGSDGATISHFYFQDVDLAIMNGASVDDVTVTQNTFLSSVQGVSNWGGSNS